MNKHGLAIILGVLVMLGCASKGQATDEVMEKTEDESAIKIEDYHKVMAEDFAFYWLADEEGMLHVKLSAPTTGWVAVGFAPSSMMKDADFIIGYVKDGEVEISDEFGISPVAHKPDEKLGGKDNVTDKSGWEKNDFTEISFTIPLNSGDKYDKVLKPGEKYKVIFAYGMADNLISKHKKTASVEIEAL